MTLKKCIDVNLFLFPIGFCKKKKKKLLWGLPGDTVDRNLPANARNTGLTPGLGRLHMHVMRKLSLCTTATEACPSAETSGAKNKKQYSHK